MSTRSMRGNQSKQQGASLVELSIVTAFLVLVTAALIEFGQVFLQSVTLSMVALESTLLAGTVNLTPGNSVHPAVSSRELSLMTLPGQSRAFAPNSVVIAMEYSKTGNLSLPPESARVSLNAVARPLFGFSQLFPAGIPLNASYVGPNYLGAPLSIGSGFQNPDPLVDCNGNDIPGCSTWSCASTIPCP